MRRRDPGGPMVQPSLASIGLVKVSRSFPYRHSPASSRRESRVSRPVRKILGFDRILDAMDVALVDGCISTSSYSTTVDIIQLYIYTAHKRHLHQIKVIRENNLHYLCCSTNLYCQKLHIVT